MGDILRDVSRLGLIYQMPIASEKFAIDNHLKDFIYYYFSRFVANTTHIFSNFARTEIADFNARNTSRLALLTKHPTLSLDGMIVPIPRGMIKSYKFTMAALLGILKDIQAETIKSDLDAIEKAMGTGKLKGLALPSFTKVQFNASRDAIGKLFGKVGLSHATAQHVLVSKLEIRSVNDDLLSVTDGYYRQVLALNPLLKTIETRYAKVTWSDQDRLHLSALLMSLAYRLSIFAIVMDHIQDIEHAFVKDLTILLGSID